jgi:hypothetical protein
MKKNMDLGSFFGMLQVFIATAQLKLDHFNKATKANNQEERDFVEFDSLGEAIRFTEYAIGETISYLNQNRRDINSQRLANLWEEASLNVRRIPNGNILADIAFEKSLFWRNPDYFNNQDESQIYRISLTNVLEQLRKIRVRYDNLQKKISDYQ